MKKTRISLKAIVFTSLCGLSMSALSFSLEGTVWSEAPKKTEANLLYAIALAESQRATEENRAYVRPWPWAVNVNGKGTWFDSKEEAKVFIKDFLSKGGKSIDIGVMQINTRWHYHRFSDPIELLDVKTSIRIGEEILIEAIKSAPGDLELGIGRYHHWEEESVSRNYGRKVLNYKRHLDSVTVKEGL